MVNGDQSSTSQSSGAARHLVRSALWNYLGYFCELFAGALLLAYIVRRVSLEDYGMFVLAQSSAGILYLLDFGLGGVLVPLYSWTLSSKDMGEAAKLLSTLVLALLGLGTLGATLLSLLAALVPGLIHLPSTHTALVLKLLVLAAAAVMFALPTVALDCFLQASNRFDRLTQVQTSMLVVRVGLTVAVVAMGKGIVGIALVRVVVAFAQLIVLWIAIRFQITGPSLRIFCFDPRLLPQVLKTTGWAFGGDLAQRIGGIAEKLILAGLCSFGQVAMFGLASRLPEHFVQFAGQGLSVLSPFFSHSHGQGDHAPVAKIFRDAYSACLTCLTPLIALAALCARPLMQVWGGKSYASAGPVMVWLLVLALSRILEHPSELVLYSHDRVKVAARFRAIETAGKMGCALALAVPFGAAGVAAGAALWQWCVNLFLYLPAGSRVAETKPLEILLNAGTANMKLIGTFILGAVAVVWAAYSWPPSISVAVWAGVSCLYAALWFTSSALPILRSAKHESVAASSQA